MEFSHARAWALIALVLVGARAAAAPMGFKDSTMAMGDFGPRWRELYANYALTARDAVGLSSTWMRADDGSTTALVSEVTYTRLAQRWNLPQAQANVWLMGGVGEVRSEVRNEAHSDGGSALSVTPGVQVDYETTRVYLSANARLYRARGVDHDFAALRAGVSLYETEYDETQPWLLVEARRMRHLSERTEITPMARFVNKDYFIEVGVSTTRMARLNFMHIF